ncbi:MAG: T9SS type A sorting domain-containing protein [Saprospiraceae bacterium]|nr:T9SS type A sorting domain-containing protein [Saprospiraceae bacterium]
MKIYYFGIFILLSILFMAYSTSTPTSGSGGYTGAPGDGYCANCHTGSNSSFSGIISIDGLPPTVTSGIAYPLTVTITDFNNNVTKAGFQIVSLRENNTNAGEFSNNSSNTVIKTAGGKKYFGHQPASNFNGASTLTFNVDWTPNSTNNSAETITFYGASVLANGNGSNQNDKVINTNTTTTMEITPDPLSLTFNDISETTCYESPDGSATVVVSGGTPPYNYLWENGETTATATNLSQGFQTVTITDQGGMSESDFVEITGPDLLVGFISMLTNPTCSGNNDGYVFIEALGGTPNYEFNWSNGAYGNELNNLPPGFYSVTVNDVNNCEANLDFEIFDPPTMVINQVSITNVSCGGYMDGSINLEVSGGIGNLSYYWSNGDIGNAITNLSGGTYNVTIEDENACQIIETFSLSEPSVINVVANLTDNLCVGDSIGSIKLNLSGGMAPYSIQWSNGQTSESLNQLIAGIYSCTISDQNGCNNNQVYTILEGDSININSIKQDVSCFNGEDGSINLNIIGGAAPYDILWSNGDTSENIINLTSGKYYVSIYDNYQCFVYDSVEIYEPQLLDYQTQSTDNSCFGLNEGEIVINVTGGVMPYTILWNNDMEGNTLNSLANGSYIAEITDNNGCSVTTDTISISSPEEITFIENITNESFEGAGDGSISVDIYGGTPEYSYLWSIGDTTSTINSLQSGNYQLTVTDANGCTAIKGFFVNQGSCQLQIDLMVENLSCYNSNDGQLEIKISGGIEPYAIFWSNGVADTTLITEIPSGLYSITVTDSVGCIIGIEDIEVSQPDSISIENVQITNASSNISSDGNIELTLSGGTTPYSINWYNDKGVIISNDAVLTNVPYGYYYFEVVDNNNCSFTSEIYYVDFISSSNDFVNVVTRIFPNPARDYYCIQTNADNIIQSVSMFDIRGNELQPTIKKKNNEIIVDTKNISSGLYFLKITTNENVVLNWKKILIF